MKYFYTVFIFSLFSVFETRAQLSPGVEWERCVPNASIKSIVTLPDSAFTVAFDTKSCSDSSAAGFRNYDRDGNLLWEKLNIASTGKSFHIFSLTTSVDHGYYFAGSIDSASVNFNWLAKTDSNGNIEWQKQFLVSDTAQALFGKVIQLGDGTLIYGCDIISSSRRDVEVMQLDENGNILWTKSFGGTLFDCFRDIIISNDGGFIVAAYSSSNDGNVTGNHGGKDIWLMKLDSNGNIVWQKCLGGTHDEEVRTVISMVDGYVAGGMSKSNDGDVTGHHGSSSYYDDWVVKVDEAGNLLWQKSFGGNLGDFAQQMVSLGDGNFVLTGSSYSAGNGIADHHGSSVYDDQWTVKFDGNGNILWTKSTGGFGDDWSNCIASLNAGEIIIAGGDVSDDGDHHSGCFSNDCHVIEGGWIVKLNEHCPAYPVALFSADQNGKNITLSNESYNAQNYLWDFGDGDTTSIASPSHTYVLNGTYQVCLTAIDSCSSKTSCIQVSTCTDTIIAAFSVTYPGGASVQFTDLSINAAKWQWDFGDGNFDSIENPVHSYVTNGSYTVTLTIYDSCDHVSITSQVINTCNGFVVDFGYTANGNTVTFSDLSAAIDPSWSWDFGDGNFSIAQNPVHVYVNGGTYTVCLTVTPSGCLPQTICKTIALCTAVYSPPFSYTKAYNVVTFSDSSQNAIAWQWDFGDGNFSTDQNPQHTYAQSGAYTVCEIIFTGCNNDTICETVSVDCLPVQSSFGFITNNLDVSFSDLSMNATSWQWDFGDGNSATLQNPDHLYGAAGNYLACLIAFNPCGSDTLCQDVMVQCAPFNAGFTFLQFNDSVVFTDQSANAIQWQWDFGDGSSSTLQNPVHIYITDGTFYACLIAYDGCSYDTLCDSVNVIPTVLSSLHSNKIFFSIFPNPVANDAIINYSVLASSVVSITLFTIAGIESGKIFEGNVTEGMHTLMFNAKGLVPGSYFLELKSEHEFAVLKLIIQ